MYMIGCYLLWFFATVFAMLIFLLLAFLLSRICLLTAQDLQGLLVLSMVMNMDMLLELLELY